MSGGRPLISAVIVVHDEEAQLAECLKTLTFCDELIVVLDRCTDKSKEIAQIFTSHLIEGAWEHEGMRRRAGIDVSQGVWILEVDADERVSPTLADEIRRVASHSTVSWHLIPVDNYLGDRLVRYGWGDLFGKGVFAGLYRHGAKIWGDQRVHPEVTLSGSRGPTLQGHLIHRVDQNISGLLARLDRYTTARAKDMREGGRIGGLWSSARRFFAQFWRCYVVRRGYREGPCGFLIALVAGLYPILSYLKARLEKE